MIQSIAAAPVVLHMLFAEPYAGDGLQRNIPPNVKKKNNPKNKHPESQPQERA